MEELEYSAGELSAFLRACGVQGHTIMNSQRAPIFFPKHPKLNDYAMDKYWVAVSGQTVDVTHRARAVHFDMPPGFNNILAVQRFADNPAVALVYNS